MKIGIIGFGSIGKRHAGNLAKLGYNDITLLRYSGDGNDLGFTETRNIELLLKGGFDFILISNPTSKHLKTMKPFLEKGINLLVEKPSVASRDELVELEKMLSSYKGKGMVAYNMRFHPCIKRVKQLLSKGIIGKIYSSRLTVGQYLPDWRPGQDYKKGVSALKSLGGGVVLELIHEIDLALFLFGKPASPISSFAGKISDLEIETEDISEILYKAESGPIVSIHQDYLFRGYKRSVEIMGEKGSIICDLKGSEIIVTGEDGETVLHENIVFERNDMYIDLVKYYISCLKENVIPAPSITDSLESVKIATTVKENNNI